MASVGGTQAPAPDGAGRITIRPYEARDLERAAELLYESSGGLYDRYAGTRELAERALQRALRSPATTASADVVRIAEVDGEVAGAMAAMPFADWTPRAYAFLRATLRAIGPWRWPRALWMYRITGRATPEPSRRSLYVDSLAVGQRFQRRGVASALLSDAEALARASGLDAVTLDTWADNEPAIALYAGRGFVEVARAPGTRSLPGGVSLIKRLGA